MVVTCPEIISHASKILELLFIRCEESGASDIHLSAGVVPRIRIDGILRATTGFDVVKPEIATAIGIILAKTSFPESSGNADSIIYARLLERGSIDGAVTSGNGTRYRFNVFRDNGNTAVALRRLDDEFRTLAELCLPNKLLDFCSCRDGLFVVTGPTGSGKSTTLATLVDAVNRTREGHIITIEDPVEYLHKSRSCLVNQRQVGRDSPSFNTALVDSLREDPDVILVGEIREVDTIRTAITAAETGHLVFTTLHSGDCAGAIERLVSVFPAGEQDGIRHQLAMVLRGIFAQHLLPPIAGGRRIPAYELLVATTAVANLIATGRINQIASTMESGRAVGMITLDQCLADLVTRRKISENSALALTRNPESLMNRVKLEGPRL